MSDMFLSEDEIEYMTKFVQPQKQAEQLNRLGIMHKRRADGSILVLRSHVINVMGGGETVTQESTYEPNWNAL